MEKKKLLTLEQIKDEFSGYAYVAEKDTYELIDFFKRMKDNKSTEKAGYQRIAEEGLLSNWNNDIMLMGHCSEREKVHVRAGSSQIAATIRSIANKAIKDKVEAEIIPAIDKEINHLDLVVKSLMSLYAEA